MSGIFISYRREDSQSAAGRLADFLEREFGTEQLFRDVDAIKPGVDFADTIEKELSRCKVVLTVIGPRWLVVTDKHGRRRLDLPDDWIRLETATALRRNILVIPILVEGAPPPPEEALPPDLKSLARRQVHKLFDDRWDYDVQQLVAVLEHTAGIKRKRHPKEEPKGRSSKVVKTLAWVGAIFILIAIFAMLQEPSTPVMPLQMQQSVAPGPAPLASGAPTSACGCWGYVAAGAARPNPQCASGYETATMCAGWCPAGGSPWQSTCQ